jgi:serine/threonine protein kinase/tetratricopeptide (TPR) repeat protein
MTLSRGTRLGPYEVTALLGSGGMAEVYRARDTRLGRDVAIKILPDDISADAEALERFKREARTASRLNHPHLVTIYDIGDEPAGDRRLHYIAMELIPGESLRHHLLHSSREMLIRYIADVAGGLAKAHEAGIVHRDLKPENVVVSEDHLAKVVDFGLAKRAAGFRADERSAANLTEEGLCIGTPGYMAPEQARGLRDLDGRVDIFAIGCILYEAIAKENPFDGDTAIDTLHRILYHEPPPLPDGAIDAIVRRCIAKDRDARYTSMREVAADLRKAIEPSIRTGGFGRRPVIASIAVLPFHNRSGNEEMRFLSDGIPEDIVRDLGRIGGLRVIASSSASRFRDTDDPRRAAHELKVEAVLVGGLRMISGMVMLDAELVNAADGTAMWGQKYTRRLTDIIELEQEIARDLCAEVRLQVAPPASRASDPDAHAAYLRGKSEAAKETSASLKNAIEFFHRAIELDPEYALPYAALAHVYDRLVRLGIAPTRECVQQQVALAQKALALDESLPEGHWGLLAAVTLNENDEMYERRVQRVLQLNPNFAPVYLDRAMRYVLGKRFDEAEAAYQQARQLDPLSPRVMTTYGGTLGMVGQRDRSLQVLRGATEQFPEYANAWAYFATGCANAGRVEEAMAIIDRFPTDANPNFALWKGSILARAGRIAEARAIADRADELASTRYVLTYFRARLRSDIGDYDQAFALLERGIEEGEWWCSWLPFDAMLAPLRPDPRFAKLVRKLTVATDLTLPSPRSAVPSAQ